MSLNSATLDPDENASGEEAAVDDREGVVRNHRPQVAGKHRLVVGERTERAPASKCERSAINVVNRASGRKRPIGDVAHVGALGSSLCAGNENALLWPRWARSRS